MRLTCTESAANGQVVGVIGTIGRRRRRLLAVMADERGRQSVRLVQCRAQVQQVIHQTAATSGPLTRLLVQFISHFPLELHVSKLVDIRTHC